MPLLTAEHYRELREREEAERKKQVVDDAPDDLDRLCDAVEHIPVGRIFHRFGVRRTKEAGE